MRALAPSIVRSPKTGKYYLTYFIEGSTYIASADSPMGPWKNATKGTAPETCRLNDGFDAQLFVDSDGEMYLSHGASEFKLSHLTIDPDGAVSIDNSHPQMAEGERYKYKTIHRIRVFGEGTALLKHDGKYYLFYAEFGSQNYCVKYATANSIWGPYTEQPGFVMQRDAVRDILGPGHVSLFQYDGDTYIGYHRQHVPFVDSKRQTCVNRITFSGDSVGLDVQNHSGMHAGNGALEKLVANTLATRETNLALGKPAIASSVSDYKGGEFAGEPFAPIPNFYKASFAVDENWGTRWMAGTDQSTPSFLIVDLGADTPIGRTETIFEHVRKVYRYKIEYLTQSDASDLAAAGKSVRWELYADRSNNAEKQSPLVDRKTVTARYLKISILSADLPRPNQSTSPARTDYLDRVSIVEFGVFAKP
ncbi:MAG: family 43 glycosylhydrolase [Tepidisphaeraceae bacterium]